MYQPINKQTTTINEAIIYALFKLYSKRKDILFNAGAACFDDLRDISDIINYNDIGAQIRHISDQQRKICSMQGHLLKFIDNII